jgi:hypothetical protein
MEAEEEEFNQSPDEVAPRPLFNPKAMMDGRGWAPGDGGTNVYVDGSTGFRHGGKHGGVAVYWMGNFWGYATNKLGPNHIEMAAYKCVYELIQVRPLIIHTDSSYVQKRGAKDRDSKTIWTPRCSTPEMKLVDALAKLCACTGENYCGPRVRDIVSFTGAIHGMLSAIYDCHYGKGSPHDQSVSNLARHP